MFDFRKGPPGPREELDELLTDWGSDVPARPGFKDDLWRKLDAGFTRKSRRRRSTLAVMVGTIALLSISNPTGVGSDAFDLVFLGEVINGHKIMIHPFTGDRIGVNADDQALDEAIAEGEYLNHVLEAGGGNLVESSGWEFDGEIRLIGGFEIEYGGQTHLMSNLIDKEPSKAFYDKYYGLYDAGIMTEFMDACEAGTEPVDSVEILRRSNRTIRYNKYVRHIEGYGKVTYWLGLPID